MQVGVLCGLLQCSKLTNKAKAAKTVVLKVWAPDQQHQKNLRTGEKYRSEAPPQTCWFRSTKSSGLYGSLPWRTTELPSRVVLCSPGMKKVLQGGWQGLDKRLGMAMCNAIHLFPSLPLLPMSSHHDLSSGIAWWLSYPVHFPQLATIIHICKQRVILPSYKIRSFLLCLESPVILTTRNKLWSPDHDPQGLKELSPVCTLSFSLLLLHFILLGHLLQWGTCVLALSARNILPLTLFAL